MIGFIIEFLKGQTVGQLRRRGAIIGENVHLMSSSIDKYTAFLIEIGNNVTITNAIVLAHDASTKSFIGYTKIQKTTIGNNVFIGMGAIVQAGSHIGNNVIIGAGANVNGVIPDNSVVLGNPAKVVCSIDEYVNKNKERMEKSLVVEKMCSDMKKDELINLREKLGDSLGYEV